MERPDFFELKNGSKVKLPFTQTEYQNRLDNLRTIISKNNLDMTIITCFGRSRLKGLSHDYRTIASTDPTNKGSVGGSNPSTPTKNY